MTRKTIYVDFRERVAIVESICERYVRFRRSPDGELMRVCRRAFEARYKERIEA